MIPSSNTVKLDFLPITTPFWHFFWWLPHLSAFPWVVFSLMYQDNAQRRVLGLVSEFSLKQTVNWSSTWLRSWCYKHVQYLDIAADLLPPPPTWSLKHSKMIISGFLHKSERGSVLGSTKSSTLAGSHKMTSECHLSWHLNETKHFIVFS